jgi:hypothetical protein
MAPHVDPPWRVCAGRAMRSIASQIIRENGKKMKGAAIMSATPPY